LRPLAWSCPDIEDLQLRDKAQFHGLAAFRIPGVDSHHHKLVSHWKSPVRKLDLSVSLSKDHQQKCQWQLQLDPELES
jgi:hypothetical protein